MPKDRDTLSLYEVETGLRDIIEELLDAQEAYEEAQVAHQKLQTTSEDPLERHHSFQSVADSYQQWEESAEQLRQAAKLWLQGARKKRDGVARYLLMLKAMKKAQADEAKRLRKAQKRVDNAIRAIEEWVLFVARSVDTRELTGEVHRLCLDNAREGADVVAEDEVPKEIEYKGRKYVLGVERWEPRKTPILELYRAKIAAGERPEGVPGCRYLPSGKNPPPGYEPRYTVRVR